MRPGAAICRSGNTVLIDGKAVATAATTDRLGSQLPVWRGCRVLAESQVFLMVADAPGSLDGRYFGPTDVATIAARAHPIWMRGG